MGQSFPLLRLCLWLNRHRWLKCQPLYRGTPLVMMMSFICSCRNKKNRSQAPGLGLHVYHRLVFNVILDAIVDVVFQMVQSRDDWSSHNVNQDFDWSHEFGLKSLVCMFTVGKCHPPFSTVSIKSCVLQTQQARSRTFSTSSGCTHACGHSDLGDHLLLLSHRARTAPHLLLLVAGSVVANIQGRLVG